MLRMFADVPCGLVVASSDVLLNIPESFYPAPGKPSAWSAQGATGLAIPTDAELGPNHGVYHSEERPRAGEAVPRVKKFFQKAKVCDMDKEGAVRRDAQGRQTVLIDSGVIFFSGEATSILLDLAHTDPLDSCTYQGLDCGRPALRVELYSDIMMAMGGGLGLSKGDYSSFDVVPSEVAKSGDAKMKAALLRARDVMWERLYDMPFYAAVVEGGDFAHVGTTLEYLQLLTAPTPAQKAYKLLSRAAWFCEGTPVGGLEGCIAPAPTPAAAVAAALPCVQNSLFVTPGALGSGSVVEHSVLSGEWEVGVGCLVSSVRTLPSLVARDGIAIQEVGMGGGGGSGGGSGGAAAAAGGRGGRCVTVLGTRDPIKEPFTSAKARVCGVEWGELFGTLCALGGLRDESAAKDAIWGRGAWERSNGEGCTLWTARLWPQQSPPPSSSTGTTGTALVDALRLGGYGDPVDPDRVALWLQWLAGAAGGGSGTGSGSGSGGGGGSGGGPGAAAAPAAQLAARRAHYVCSDVVSAWLGAPRLCLRDILGAAEASAEFAWRRSLRGNIDCALLVASIAQDASGSCADLVRRVGNSATPTNTRLEGAAGTALGGGAAARRAARSTPLPVRPPLPTPP